MLQLAPAFCSETRWGANCVPSTSSASGPGATNLDALDPGAPQRAHGLRAGDRADKARRVDARRPAGDQALGHLDDERDQLPLATGAEQHARRLPVASSLGAEV